LCERKGGGGGKKKNGRERGGGEGLNYRLERRRPTPSQGKRKKKKGEMAGKKEKGGPALQPAPQGGREKNSYHFKRGGRRSALCSPRKRKRGERIWTVEKKRREKKPKFQEATQTKLRGGGGEKRD